MKRAPIKFGYVLLVTILVLFLFCMGIGAQALAYKVLGKVIDGVSGNGLSGVTVKIGTLLTTTDVNGNYIIDNVPNGTYTIKAALAHYTIPDRVITVKDADLTGQDLIAIGESRVLGVDALPARKDTTMLCLDGCPRTGDHRWDAFHMGTVHYCDHASWQCWVAATAMLNHYYGGSLTQDEIKYHVKGGGPPEGDLPHGRCGSATLYEAEQVLAWALQTTVDKLNCSYFKPTEAELKSFIDDDRPLRYGIPGHAMVLDGYRYIDKNFWVRLLNWDNDGAIRWENYATLGFTWYCAPDAGLIGRVMDPDISLDSDGDGINDFDEKHRFHTGVNNPDSDHDGIPDKIEIASYVFDEFGNYVPVNVGRHKKVMDGFDGDGLRPEVDPDTDNGGVKDGDEDINANGIVDDDETDPFDPKDDIKLDLVFLIDTTGSMWDDIAAAKAAAVDIVNKIDSETNDYRIAVVSFEDFPVDPYGNASCGDATYHDVLYFSSDKSQIISAIQSLTLRCGADWPEAHYSALMHCLQKSALGGWRDNVKKVIILMTDAPPHDPEPFTGYTMNDVTSAAIALDPAIIYPISIGWDSIARSYMETLAEETGGKVFSASNASDVVDAIMKAIETTFNAPTAEANGPYFGEVGIPITLDGSDSYDTDGVIVLYEWDIDNDGIYDISTTNPKIAYTYLFEYSGLIKLRVTDNDGLTGIDTAIVEINAPSVPGDLDDDGDVDRDDVKIIQLYRNQPASVCPKCDIDEDGTITVLDARKIILMCTCSRCICP